MKSTIRNSGRLALAIAGFSMAFAVTARADCGVSVTRFSSLSPSAESSIPDRAIPAEGALQASDTDGATRDEGAPIPSIVGLWKTTFTSGGQVVDEGFDQWGSDGNEVLNDDPAPATGNVCLGVYTRMGSTYKLKHPSWTFDNNGNVTGTAIIREQVTLNGPNNYKGTFTVDIYDLSNNHLAHFGGTIAAQRITVDF